MTESQRLAEDINQLLEAAQAFLVFTVTTKHPAHKASQGQARDSRSAVCKDVIWLADSEENGIQPGGSHQAEQKTANVKHSAVLEGLPTVGQLFLN